jgi:hypothetical protein
VSTEINPTTGLRVDGNAHCVQSVAPKTKIESVMTEDTVAMLSERLSTPLQFEYYPPGS